MKKYADIKISLTVEFEDDGELDLKDKAHETAMRVIGWPDRFSTFVEVVGEVRDTKMPEAKNEAWVDGLGKTTPKPAHADDVIEDME